MKLANLSFQAPDTLQVSGELNFYSTLELQGLGLVWLNKEPIVQVDLAAVTNSNSAGLALLLEWQREAKHRGRKLIFINIPANLQAAAEVYGLMEILT